MEALANFRSRFLLLDRQHIDTDQIIPARFLKQTDKAGLGKNLFYDWRYDANGAEHADHVLNQKAGQGIRVLVAGANFGCGSSREHAVWALHDYGFRVILSPSMGDIFKSNAVKNGMLPVPVSADFYQELVRSPDAHVDVDLATERLSLDHGPDFTFKLDPFAKLCLMQGVDQLGYLLQQREKIATFEKGRSPW